MKTRDDSLGTQKSIICIIDFLLFDFITSNGVHVFISLHFLLFISFGLAFGLETKRDYDTYTHTHMKHLEEVTG